MLSAGDLAIPRFSQRFDLVTSLLCVARDSAPLSRGTRIGSGNSILSVLLSTPNTQFHGYSFSLDYFPPPKKMSAFLHLKSQGTMFYSKVADV